jgi:hypothetical protein
MLMRIGIAALLWMVANPAALGFLIWADNAKRAAG